MAKLRETVASRAEPTVGWLASAPSTALAHLGRLRERSEVEVHQEGEQIWLRGQVADEELDRVLRSILGCRRFNVLKDGQIVRVGANVPCGRAPVGDWEPLRQWLAISIPTSRFAISRVTPAKLSLVRSSNPLPSGLLRVSWSAWCAYVQTAPQIRLQRWVFAASKKDAAGEDWAVVVGQPLPPIQGEHFSLQHGVAAPVGFTWWPTVDARVLNQAFGLEEGDLALLSSDGSCILLRSDQFVAATRSAVRLTEGVCDDAS